MKKKYAFSTLLLSLFSIITTHCFGQSELKLRKQNISMETIWSKSLDTVKPLNEYPRPQMERSIWWNLNGVWQYAISKINSVLPSQYDGEILVPYPIESSLSRVKRSLHPDEILWYKRHFVRPNLAKDNRLMLNFGAVDYHTTVFVNKRRIGDHFGGYTSFSYDITDALKEGDNEIVVKVIDSSNTGVGPCGKQTLNPANIYYTATSGIWQTVWLEIVPSERIDYLKITPNVDKSEVEIIAGANKEVSNCKIEVILGNRPDSKKITAEGMRCTIPIANARLWSPTDPYLYNIEVRLIKKGKLQDVVKSYFGMRKVSIQKDNKGFERIFLNNKYVYNLGALDQGFWPDGLYTPPSDDAMIFDIKAIKSMGFNTIRKHIKIEPARWYYYADKMGIMVWQDFVNPNPELPNGAKLAFEKQVSETISQLYNHPCITTWVIFNEKWGQYDQKRITEWVRNLDNTRLINGHSGELLYVNNQLRSPSENPYVSSDIIDIHSYPFPKIGMRQTGKVQVVGEFGGIGVAIDGHIWDDLVSGWGYDGIVAPSKMKRLYCDMVDSLVILEKQGLSASIYTQPFDVESELNGLLTYDRKVAKLSFNELKNINNRLWPTPIVKEDVVAEYGLEIADPNPKELLGKLDDYYSGKRDSLFLRTLALMAESNDSLHLGEEIAGAYIGCVRDTMNIDNVRFLAKFIKNYKSFGLNIFLRNSSKVEDIIGKEKTTDVIRWAVDSRYRPIIFRKNAVVNLDSLENEAIREYGNYGELVILNLSGIYYFLNKDVDKFYKTKMRLYKKFKESVSNLELNNDAWFIFENVVDKDKLEGALIWSKEVIEKEPTANYYDTYANLLYKLGRTDDAIKMQEIGLKLAQGNGLIENARKNLDKMRKGEKTWK